MQKGQIPACKIIAALLALSLYSGSKAQQPVAPALPISQTVELGTHTRVKVAPTCYNPIQGIYFVHVHEDEATSVEAALAVLKARDFGCFVTLQHGNGRNIKFTLNGTVYQFDPNRMFTQAGRMATLKKFGQVSQAAAENIRLLAEYFTRTYIDSSRLVVALHNNTNDGGLTIKSYAKGGDYAAEAAEVYINPSEDPDDFVYTTTRQAFEFFKAMQLNVLLQQNEGVTDDGSLSVYAAQKGIDYINIEAEHGRTAQQIKMLEAAFTYIARYYATAPGVSHLPEGE
ncbi:MAG: hypothetical protein MUF24_09025 [Chitinophagaceae bacterium]|jgi:hypothetical protein|nr:hypothetical protein [Chitinophagaceae bacterium]